jgi:hypothetical protein
MNVVPNQLTIGFDMRITPTTNIVDFEKQLIKWTEEVSSITLHFLSFQYFPIPMGYFYFHVKFTITIEHI